jgi:hypothetical protein
LEGMVPAECHVVTIHACRRDYRSELDRLRKYGVITDLRRSTRT